MIMKNLVIFAGGRKFQRLDIGENWKQFFLEGSQFFQRLTLEQLKNLVIFAGGRKFQRLDLGENWKRKNKLSFF